MKTVNKNIFLIFLSLGAFHGCSVLVPDSMIKGMHQDMDKNHDGHVDYNEYLQSGSNNNVEKEAKEKGMTVEEYQKWDFNRADTDRDGKVTVQEIINLFRKEL
jgi:Ca2+-binding EF-hand superfamily protein